MNRFVMTEAGREIDFKIVSAQIAFQDAEGGEPACKIQVIAAHPDLDENAVLWFGPLKGVRGPKFSLHEEVMERGGGFHLFEDSALENVHLELRLEKQGWRLDVTCALFSMGWESQSFKVSTDLKLCDEIEPDTA
jgi:hypothetical protein